MAQGMDDGELAQALERRHRHAEEEVFSFAPHYAGSPLTVGGSGDAAGSAVGEHSHKPVAGHHLPPLRDASGERTCGRLGDGFAIAAADPAVLDTFARSARPRNIPLQEVLLGANTQAHALVRPDEFVAWTGEGDVGDAEAAAILSQACGF